MLHSQKLLLLKCYTVRFVLVLSHPILPPYGFFFRKLYTFSVPSFCAHHKGLFSPHCYEKKCCLSAQTVGNIWQSAFWGSVKYLHNSVFIIVKEWATVTLPVEYLSVACCLCSVLWDCTSDTDGFCKRKISLSWSIHSALECFLNFVEGSEMGTCGRKKVGFDCKLPLLQSLFKMSSTSHHLVLRWEQQLLFKLHWCLFLKATLWKTSLLDEIDLGLWNYRLWF